MPYISLDNLTQYNGRLRDYIDGSFDKLDGANWRKTSAAQSVTCYPIPETALEPEVSFLFSETPPESGTKGPDNPSTIVGVESVSCNVCESEGVDDTPYSIDLGGTYYGGTVNFATGVLEVTWEGISASVLSFYSSDITTLTNCATFRATLPHMHASQSTCNKFTVMSGSQDANDVEHYRLYGPSGTSAAIQFWINKSRLSDLSDSDSDATWRIAATNWIAENNVTIVYELSTPLTVPLTPVLVRSLPALSHYAPRQNTIYTPHESVQVGYAKSASKTSQDLTNAIVALGGNI